MVLAMFSLVLGVIGNVIAWMLIKKRNDIRDNLARAIQRLAMCLVDFLNLICTNRLVASCGGGEFKKT